MRLPRLLRLRLRPHRVPYVPRCLFSPSPCLLAYLFKNNEPPLPLPRLLHLSLLARVGCPTPLLWINPHLSLAPYASMAFMTTPLKLFSPSKRYFHFSSFPSPVLFSFLQVNRAPISRASSWAGEKKPSKRSNTPLFTTNPLRWPNQQQSNSIERNPSAG